MALLAHVACPLDICRGNHRLVWDHIYPPDPTRQYAFACPFGKRLTLVNITGTKWFRQGTREAYDLQGLAADMIEWQAEPLFREHEDGTPY